MTIYNLKSINLEDLNSYKNKNVEFIVFGAGAHGYIASNALKILGIKIKYIFDNSKHRVGNYLNKDKIVKPNNQLINLEVHHLLTAVAHSDVFAHRAVAASFRNRIAPDTS